MRLRSATPADSASLAAIYHDTIHRVNCRDYTLAQCHAWAPPESREPEGWIRKQASRLTLLAEEAGQIVGFGELEPEGHIDCFYVHHDWQRRGVGRRLLANLEQAARSQGVDRIVLEASVTAQPFFVAQGYRVVRHQQVERRGEWLANAVMEKRLDQSSA
ncbi:MAG: GNAT family N-acetyltransferase [Planctomycetaceae bacterium]|jgi:ribosomal protein S18 acetylase RimI-like enzyme